MKWIKLAVLVFVVLFCGTQVRAQAHSVGIGWVASTSTGATYFVYRAPCNGTVTGGVCSLEGPFSKISGSTPIAGLSYSDNSVVGGAAYAYYTTAFCASNTQCPGGTGSSGFSGESAPSNHVAVVVPNPPAPPTSLQIGTVAKNQQGANTTLSATWFNTPNAMTTFSFTTPGSTLASGELVNASGTYAASYQVKLKPGAQVIFTICDKTTKACVSQTV